MHRAGQCGSLLYLSAGSLLYVSTTISDIYTVFKVVI